MKKLTLTLAALALGGAAALAQTSFTSTNAPYTQNFDTLGTNSSAPWTNNVTLPGWYTLLPSNNAPTVISNVTGGSTTGAFGNFSSNAVATDRSIGWIFANSQGPAGTFLSIGFGLSNNTGINLDEFTLSYIGREWRGYSNNTPQLSFQYKIGGVFDNSQSNSLAGDTNWTSVPALNFVLPVTNNNAQVNGLLPGNFTSLTSTVTGISWNTGDVIWFRWRQENLAGTDAQMAIDNVSFSAIPEPTTVAMLGLAGVAALGFAIRRRRK